MSKTIYSIPKNHYIYLLVDQNHKKYGGVRTCEGLPENDDYMGSSKLVKESIKNGVVFTKHIIKTFDTRIEANEYEEEWLTLMNAGYNSDWYNQTNGAKNFCTYGKKASEETRRKWSKVRKGIKRSEETKKKMSKARKGIKRPEETKKKISESLTGRKHTKERTLKMSEAAKGKKRSEESKRKQSESLTGIKRSEETKKKMSKAKKEYWKLRKQQY